jgi:2-polyprenyl-3-methyl-5-hydroxy-6-metoxy-1,4-benzoquinol methylase
MPVSLKTKGIQGTLNILRKVKMPKFRMNRLMLRVASLFIDYEAEALPPDGRIIEYGFALSKLLNRPIGKLLDVGCIARHNYIPSTMCFSGWDVSGIDIRPSWGFKHKKFYFSQQDIRDGLFMDNQFDFVVCISTIEHIGLASYYGETVEDLEGDVKAAQEMVRVTKPMGIIVVTVPYKKQFEIKPGYRIYDERIYSMFKGTRILDEIIYIGVNDDWIPADKEIEDEGFFA